MSADAVLVVADTLRKHAFGHTEESRVSSRTVDHCRCGWRSTFEHRTHADHVAAAVVDALGGLERETRFKYTHLGTGRWTILESTDVQVARKIAGTTHELTEVSRWVSGWVREPAEEGL
ncbi:hypothetical protein AB4Z39_10680 [Mycobacterium adipatum]|uniref:hypothetical protein n=1 Tax=Mycobacterium adipatum TaxID=1682113 RepID=UPI0034E0B4D3